MSRPVGRPRGLNRQRMNVYVLPETKRAIDKAIKPHDENFNSQGKVIDCVVNQVRKQKP